jgi:CheY-like chemotaxis protein
MWSANIRKHHIFGKAKTKVDCPVIAVTACTIESDLLKRAQEVGMKEVITKPVTDEKIARILKLYFF